MSALEIPTVENSPERKLSNFIVHEVPGRDGAVTSERERVEQSLLEMESMGFYGDNDLETALSRKRLSAIDFRNPATKELIARIPGVEKWLDLVPTVQALEPLYDPEVEALSNGHVVGDELREWLKNIADAIGIRNRAAMLKYIFAEKTAEASAEDVASMQFLSIASGVAQPILESAQGLMRTTGEAPHLTLVDLSESALKGAREHAASLALSGHITTERMNVLRRQGLDAPIQFGEVALDALTRKRGPESEALSRFTLPAESYDVVEAVGILEYLKQHDWLYRYNKVMNIRTVQAGAETLLKNSYRLVKPGGDLLVGNMLIDRPQLGFTLNTIQWPHIQPRSIEDMMGIFDDAGLEGEKHVYVAEDPSERIYALYRVHKPEAAEA